MKPCIRVTFFFLLFLIAGCKKENDRKINIPPIADAGSNQVLLLPTDSVELRGSGIDTDGYIVSYQWSITGYFSQIGQYGYFNYNTAIAKLKNLPEGIYWCELKVTDNGGLNATDEVIVRVVSPNCECYPDPCDAFGDPCDPWDY